MSRLAPFLLLLAGPAAAVPLPPPATLTEGVDVADFSDAWNRPTEAPAHTGAAAGSGTQNDHDAIRFTDLEAGAWELSVSFEAMESPDSGTSAGGIVMISGTPFAHEWDTEEGAAKFALDASAPRRSVTLRTPETFAGDLWVALRTTYGAVDWRMDLAAGLSRPVARPEAPSPPRVPAPPAILLLAGAIGTGLLIRRLSPAD